jgi:hypothetical protein
MLQLDATRHRRRAHDAIDALVSQCARHTLDYSGDVIAMTELARTWQRCALAVDATRCVV